MPFLFSCGRFEKIKTFPVRKKTGNLLSFLNSPWNYTQSAGNPVWIELSFEQHAARFHCWARFWVLNTYRLALDKKMQVPSRVLSGTWHGPLAPVAVTRATRSELLLIAQIEKVTYIWASVRQLANREKKEKGEGEKDKMGDLRRGKNGCYTEKMWIVNLISLLDNSI